jgi:hypothetical protein
MRTLPAALQTAMDSGVFTPYIKLWTGPNTPNLPLDPISYKLEGTSLEATLPDGDFDATSMMIERGALINGSPVTIKSDFYYAKTYTCHKGIVHVKGDLLPYRYQTVPADQTYSQVINACLANAPYAQATYDGTPSWKNYKFYPAGKGAIFSPIMQLVTVLKQKYFIWMVDDGFDGVHNNIRFIAVGLDKYSYGSWQSDWILTDLLYKKEFAQIYKCLLWKDETGTVHKDTGTSAPYHNLGYLETTAARPVSIPNYAYCLRPDETSSNLKVHLARQTGDEVYINQNTPMLRTWARVEVIEVFDPKQTPSWHQIVKPIVFLSNTEGGAMPESIKNATIYVPLVTGTFGGILSDADNNIQTAMETLDKGRPFLTAARTYYVSPTGNDGNDGLTAATPFLTIQKAFDTASALDFKGYTVTIQLADGTYTSGLNIAQSHIGGQLIIQGNATTPSNVVISTTGVNCINITAFLQSALTVGSMKLQTATSGNCLYAGGGGAIVYYGNIAFGACAGSHIFAENQSTIQCVGNYSIIGNATEHWVANTGGMISCNYRTITILAGLSISYFCYATRMGMCQVSGNTFSTTAITGTRYVVDTNAVIYTNFAGANYLPGSVAGSSSYGGQYM